MSDGVVELDTQEHKCEVFFRRFFVASKPCFDGFLQACRTYIAMDVTISYKVVGHI
jgi:hypothetical protein